MTSDTLRAGSHIRDEIARQPEAWSRAAALAPDLASALPRSGESVAVIGCGTSWFMASSYAALREGSGAGRTDAFAASLFPYQRHYDRVVVISRSGTTTEVIGAAERVGCPVVAITAVEGAPLTDVVSDAIVLDFADERSVVQTVFATTALVLLRASLGESVARVVEQASRVLDGTAGVPDVPTRLTQLSFLGQGWAYGVALEAALKMREAAQMWTEAYPQMEYRHGPIAVAEPGRAVWVLGEPVPGLAADVARTGALLVDSDLDPVADLVRVQQLAAAYAADRGLDPDSPRALSRSVVLTPS